MTSNLRFTHTVTERFLRFDRFRCIPVANGNSADWIASERFDVDDHVLRVALPGRAGQHELEALAGELASTQMNPARPLWAFHLVEHYRGGSAIIVRIHHCYADGIALVQVLLSLGDGEPGIPAPPLSDAVDVATGDLPWGLERVVREGADLIQKGLHYALHPVQSQTALQDAIKMAGELARIATLSDDAPTRLKQPLTGFRRVAWAAPISLAEVKTIAKLLGCTVNDVLISTLAGALGRYLAARGDTVAGRSVRATLPVNLRPETAQEPALGNYFGLLFVDLPIGIRHPLERLYAVRATLLKLKDSPQALITLRLLQVVGSLPASVEEQLITLLSAGWLIAAQIAKSRAGRAAAA